MMQTMIHGGKSAGQTHQPGVPSVSTFGNSARPGIPNVIKNKLLLRALRQKAPLDVDQVEAVLEHPEALGTRMPTDMREAVEVALLMLEREQGGEEAMLQSVDAVMQVLTHAGVV